MFIFADSDIEEEELRPVLEKLKKRMKKSIEIHQKKCNKSSNIDCGKKGLSKVSKDAKNLNTNQCNGSILNGQVSRKRKLENSNFINGNEENCPACNKPYKSDIKRQRLLSCLCVSTQISPNHIEMDFSSKIVSMDCEFVGVGPKKISALGRCTILDYHGNLILDIYALPSEPITDYRTPWSGIRRKDMISAVPFQCAQKDITNALCDKIVIGHAVFNDFRVLQMFHPRHLIRDTSHCKFLRRMTVEVCGTGHSLKKMSKALLGRDIQTGEHCSYEDAKAALDLYKLVQSEWEELLTSTPRKTPQPDKKHKRMSTCTPSSELSFLGDEFWPTTLFDTTSEREKL